MVTRSKFLRMYQLPALPTGTFLTLQTPLTLMTIRYILSGSARKDESNLFGVNANQKGVPLWSAGSGMDNKY